MEQTALYNQFNQTAQFGGRYDYAANGTCDGTALSNINNYVMQFGNTPAGIVQWPAATAVYSGASPIAFRCPTNPKLNSDKYFNSYNCVTGGGGPAWKTDTVSGAPSVDGTIPKNAPADNVPNSNNPMMPCYNSSPGAQVYQPGVSDQVNYNFRPHWNNGIMHMNSSNSVTSVKDGTSNVMLAGETMYVGLLQNYGFGTGSTTPGFWSWASSTRVSVSLPVQFNAAAALYGMNKPMDDFSWTIAKSREGNANGHSMMQEGFSSWHDGGGHILMADGAVRFLSDNTDLLTQQKLGNRKDGFTLGDF